jgi:histone H1/5
VAIQKRDKWGRYVSRKSSSISNLRPGVKSKASAKKTISNRRSVAKPKTTPKKPIPRGRPVVKLKTTPKKPIPRRRQVVKPKTISKKPIPRRRPVVESKTTPKKPIARRRPVAKPKTTPKKPISRRRPVAKPKTTSKKPIPRRRQVAKPKTTLKKPIPRRRLAVKPKTTTKKPAKVVKKKRPRRQYPTFISQALAAEALSLQKLSRFQDTIVIIEPEIDVGLKSFVNSDGTVDAELRLRNLPDLWRTLEGQPSLGSALSEAVRVMGAFPRQPSMGGAFWVSFGVRFGPKNEAEVEMMAKFYKRFRGLFQVGAYHTTASAVPAILNNAATVRSLVESIWDKRDLPPAQVLVRIVWTPDGQRPGRFQGEGGSAK